MGWQSGEEGGVDREGEREERPGVVRGGAVEEVGEGVAGGIGMVSLGVGRLEAGVAVAAEELDEERPALRVAGDEGMSFGDEELPVSDGSMAEIRPQISQKEITERERDVSEYLKTVKVNVDMTVCG